MPFTTQRNIMHARNNNINKHKAEEAEKANEKKQKKEDEKTAFDGSITG